MKKSRNIAATLSVLAALTLFVSAPSTAEAYIYKSSGTCSLSALKKLVQVGPSYSGTSLTKARDMFKKGGRYLNRLSHDFKDFGCRRITKRVPNMRNGAKKTTYRTTTFIRVRYQLPANWTHRDDKCVQNTTVTIKGRKYCRSRMPGSAAYAD